MMGRRQRSSMVLEHLKTNPDLTTGELGRALGIPGTLNDCLRGLERIALVVAVPRHDPDQGRQVARWRIAPPGTVPPPPRPVDPEKARRHRERDRRAQRARRARKRGLVVQPGMEAPSTLTVAASAADLPGAACRTASPDLFFGPDGEHWRARQRRSAAARAVCARCPVRAACFARAAANAEKWGVWGGVDFEVTRARQEALVS